MVKQKLTNKEEEMIRQELQKYIKPTTLPDILRRAILLNKWIPEKYQIYIPKGDYDDKVHFVVAEDALKALENNTMTPLDQLAISRILKVPKIANRIDYEYRGLLTSVKNSLVQGINIEPEDNNVRLHHKSEEMDLFGSSKKPMKGLDKKPIVHVGEDSKFGEIANEGSVANDNADEKSHTGNITVRGRNDKISHDDSAGNNQADTGTKPAGIEFGEEEDY